MPLDNLANMKSEMVEWAIDRPDLIPRFQDCIDMAIDDINKALSAPEQVSRVPLACDADGYAPLPEDYQEWREVRALSNPLATLVPLTPEGVTDTYPSGMSGTPRHFCIEGLQIRILPAPGDTEVELLYWKGVPRLTETAPGDTNWLLKKTPNAIFFGALKYVEVYKRNEAGAKMFGGLFNGIIDGMTRENKKAQWSRSRSRVAGRSTP